MTLRHWVLVSLSIVLGFVALSSGYASAFGAQQTFLPLILEKPATIPTNPTLALFTTRSDPNNNFSTNLYATTPDGTVTLLARNGRGGMVAAFSPDGRYLAYGHLYGLHDQGYELLDLVAGTHRRLIPPGGGDFVWAPNSLRYGYTLPSPNSTLSVSDISSTTGLTLVNTSELSFMWLRNEKYIVIHQSVNGVYGLYRVAIDGSGITTVQASDKDVGRLLAVLPDNRLLYIQNGFPGDDLFIINHDGTGQVRLTNTPTTYKSDYYVSPLQSLIAYRIYAPSTYDSTFHIINTSGEVVSTIQNPCRPQDTCNIRTLVWTPDESAIYYTITYNTSGITDLFRVEVSANPIPELVREGVEANLGSSPDGRYLTYKVPDTVGESTLIIRDLTTDTDTIIATGPEMHFVAWRPQP